MDSTTQNFWRKCSSCKKPIPFNAKYQVCSVSTCNGMDLVFCTVPCWDAHLGFARHRPDAGAMEKQAPAHAAVNAPGAPAPKKILISQPPPAKPNPSPRSIQTDTLVVVSKVKALIRDQSDFNTSQCAVDALTRKVVDECLKAIDHARADGRKTVMGRDVK